MFVGWLKEQIDNPSTLKSTKKAWAVIQNSHDALFLDRA
jgi:hypothetical protein